MIKVEREDVNRRGRIEIINNILSLCLKPVQKNDIMDQANLSYNQLHKYITFLVQTNFLEIRKMGQGDLYTVTEKGLSFIEEYKKLLKRFK